MLTILFILLVLALVGGGVGHSRYGYAGWSPAGLIVVVLLVMFLTGNRL
jgi:ABC-type transport system involved in cytochrome c biogenesis permease component